MAELNCVTPGLRARLSKKQEILEVWLETCYSLRNNFIRLKRSKPSSKDVFRAFYEPQIRILNFRPYQLNFVVIGELQPVHSSKNFSCLWYSTMSLYTCFGVYFVVFYHPKNSFMKIWYFYRKPNFWFLEVWRCATWKGTWMSTSCMNSHW